MEHKFNLMSREVILKMHNLTFKDAHTDINDTQCV